MALKTNYCLALQGMEFAVREYANFQAELLEVEILTGKCAPDSMAQTFLPASTGEPVFSVVICSIDPVRFERVTANYRERLSDVPHEIIGIHDARSLCEAYNRGVARARGQHLIFSHDDIAILTTDFSSRLLHALEESDIVGVAGTSWLTGETWGAAGWPFIHGLVVHPAANGGFKAAAFGWGEPLVHGMQALDGLFLAVRRTVFEHHRFDEETFDGFHFYDLDFSFSAYQMGMRLSVAQNITVLHESGGHFGESWAQYAKRFLAKHRDNLPGIAGGAWIAPEIRFDSLSDAHCFCDRFPLRMKNALLSMESVGRLQQLRRHTPKQRDMLASVARKKPFSPHCSTVDIIVCVHNALDDVARCLESILCHTAMPYRIILVDDGSDAPTRDWLLQFAREHPALLLRAEQATGYTFAANRGLRAGDAQYALLLNSDTIVTPGWLDGLIRCAESDPVIGMVGPLSNAASWQTIPEVRDITGEWGRNELPEGVHVEDMGPIAMRYSPQNSPYIPFLNGFCLLIKRALLNASGLFDEENFGAGYGEENDYCLRAADLGWKLAVADDVYVFHAQSRSYSDERRRLLSEHAHRQLIAKHGEGAVLSGVLACRENRCLRGLRASSRHWAERWKSARAGRQSYSGKRIAIILPVQHAGGGANVVVTLARALREMGVEVQLINLMCRRLDFEQAYPDLDIPVLYAPSIDNVVQMVASFDIAMATVFYTVGWLARGATLPANVRIAYLIQDFEPKFFDKGNPFYAEALASYRLIPGIIGLTLTDWNRLTVLEETGLECRTLGPMYDLDLFFPRPRGKTPMWPESPLRVAAMICPSTPYRAPARTMRVLREMSRRFGSTVEIILFGVDSDDSGFLSLPRDFSFHNLGMVRPDQLAGVLNEVDIFVDYSDYQAMGLTAMEAMGCGVAVIVPEQGGASSFARHRENAMVVDTMNFESCLDALVELVENHDLRRGLQDSAMESIPACHPEGVALRLLESIFGG